MSSAENHQYTKEEADLKAATVRSMAQNTDMYRHGGELVGEMFAVQTYEQDLDPVHMNQVFMAMAKAYAPYQDHSETSRTEEQRALNEAQALMHIQAIIAERMESVLYELRQQHFTPWVTIAAKLDEEPKQSKARMAVWGDPRKLKY